ncbi:hypothetical protein [uncultured Brevundimonas sp.]|uniref:hypothetical protein n=1 Tax=uncultured Brevundimonas sp. TaxID=213418 RepID=UPI0025FD4001|nr:hypothetical protein [uncultured Brevundimonas sp.]
MTKGVETISLTQARRMALAAQGFGVRRPEAPSPVHLERTIDRLHLHQIDSVNVLSRAHYLPAFSRLGGYERTDLDRMTSSNGSCPRRSWLRRRLRMSTRIAD